MMIFVFFKMWVFCLFLMICTCVDLFVVFVEASDTLELELRAIVCHPAQLLET